MVVKIVTIHIVLLLSFIYVGCTVINRTTDINKRFRPDSLTSPGGIIYIYYHIRESISRLSQDASSWQT